MTDPNIASGMRQGRRRTTLQKPVVFEKPTGEKVKKVPPTGGPRVRSVVGQPPRGERSAPAQEFGKANRFPLTPPTQGKAQEFGKANRFPLTPPTDGIRSGAPDAASRAGFARGAMPRPPGLAKRAAGAQSARDFAPGRALKKAIPKPTRRKTRRKAK